MVYRFWDSIMCRIRIRKEIIFFDSFFIYFSNKEDADMKRNRDLSAVGIGLYVLVGLIATLLLVVKLDVGNISSGALMGIWVVATMVIGVVFSSLESD